MKIVYFIIAYGPEFISNEVHEELGLRMRAQGHDFTALTLTSAAPHPILPRKGGGENRELAFSTRGEGKLLFSESSNGVPIYKIVVGGDPRRAKVADRLLHYNNFFSVRSGYRQFLREVGPPDIMHVEAAYPLGAIAALTPTLSQMGRENMVIIPNLQGADVMNYPAVDYGYGRWPLPRLLLRRTFARAAMVRCNSELTRNLIIREYGCAPDKATVILRNIGAWSYPPADISLSDYKQQARARLDEQFPQLRGQNFILSLSRLHPFKGIEYLIEALAQLSPSPAKGDGRVGGSVLVIAGPNRATPQFGDYGAFLRRTAERLGVADRVILTGEVPYTQSRDWLAAADVVAIPSVVDALNKVALEAAAVGTPSLLTTTTGAADLVAAAGCGVAVLPQSADALAGGLRQVLAGFDREGLLLRGPAFAEPFRSAPIADQLLKLYEEALKRS